MFEDNTRHSSPFLFFKSTKHVKNYNKTMNTKIKLNLFYFFEALSSCRKQKSRVRRPVYINDQNIEIILEIQLK